MICKTCKSEFEPIYRNGLLISKFCIKCVLTKSRKEQNKLIFKEHKEAKEKLKTHSDYIKELQKIFNTYIRLRDEKKPCISCKKPLIGKYDAGHYYPTSSYPNLRFNENNVFGQCVECNQHKHGNLTEYTINLPERIGLEQFEYLKSIRNISTKYTIAELKELIETYKIKVNHERKKNS